MKQAFSKVTLAALGAAAALAATAAWSAERATADEAVAMVKKGVQFIKANGTEKAYAEFTSKTSKFRDRDLYLVVYGLDGKVWAHGQNERMVGKVVIDLKDIDGKEFVRERVELGRARAGGAREEREYDRPAVCSSCPTMPIAASPCC